MPSAWAANCAKNFAPSRFIPELIYEQDGLCIVENPKTGRCAVYSQTVARPGMRSSYISTGYLREFSTLEQAMAYFMAILAKEEKNGKTEG